MNRTAAAALPIVLALGGALAWAGSSGSARAGGWPVFALAVGLAFGLNAVAFVPAWIARTEKFYDLVGSATYLSVVGLVLALVPPDPRALLLAAMIAVWALRLGTFLFARIRDTGRDPRFDAIKVDFARFLLTFLLQGLWVALTAGAALAAMTSTQRSTMGALEAAGFAIWLGGFVLEVVADRQKQAFRADPANADRFITTGLWARSRHPNYLGEIVLWTGVALVAAPALAGRTFVTLVSPVFVYVLLTRVSGIPLLEARARRRWGDDPAFRAYLERTPRLMLRLLPNRR